MSPINPIVLQRRLAEVGRIRIGQSVPITKRNGQPGTKPVKLESFRFTSADKVRIEQIAQAYGGEVKPWTPANGGASQWEVITEADSVPIVVPPQPVTQWMELWSGGGCVRRCDGDREMRTDVPCLCAAADEMVCKPTTRLSVLLRDIEGLGSFRLESHGWNAAAELPGMAELLARAGGFVTARLYLKKVRQVSDGQTKDFLVPAIAVDGVTPAQLLAGQAQGMQLTGTGEVAQIEAARPDYAAQAAAASSIETVRVLWNKAKEAGHLTDDLKATLTARVEALKAQPDTTPPVATVAADEAMDGEIVDDDADALWEQIVRAAGGKGMTLTDVEEAFAQANGGTTAATASAGELRVFLDSLKDAA